MATLEDRSNIDKAYVTCPIENNQLESEKKKQQTILINRFCSCYCMAALCTFQVLHKKNRLVIQHLLCVTLLQGIKNYIYH
jgi:hypothetical protein